MRSVHYISARLDLVTGVGSAATLQAFLRGLASGLTEVVYVFPGPSSQAPRGGLNKAFSARLCKKSGILGWGLNSLRAAW